MPGAGRASQPGGDGFGCEWLELGERSVHDRVRVGVTELVDHERYGEIARPRHARVVGSVEVRDDVDMLLTVVSHARRASPSAR